MFLHELHHAFFIMLVHLIRLFRCIQNNFQQKMANNYAVQRIHLTWLCVERYGVSDLSTFHEALCHISMEKNMTGLDTLLQELTKMCVLRMNINSSGRQIRPWRLFNRTQKIASKLLLAQRAVFYHKMGLVWFKKKTKTTHTFLKESNQSFAQRLHFKSITLSSLETAVIKLNPSALRRILTLATLNKTYEIIG